MVARYYLASGCNCGMAERRCQGGGMGREVSGRYEVRFACLVEMGGDVLLLQVSWCGG